MLVQDPKQGGALLEVARVYRARQQHEIAGVVPVDYRLVTLAALISPYREDRDSVRQSVQGVAPFLEIYVQASLDTCEGRDPKGLYKLAREGKIKGFTGIDDPYEEPSAPELILDSNNKEVEELAKEVCALIMEKVKL